MKIPLLSMRRIVGSLALLLPLAAALPASAQDRTLTVSAAASLTNAFKEIGTRFEAANPGTRLVFNFAASGPLIQQIIQGAPVDVFASADQATMSRGIEAKVIDTATRADFAANTVVLIEPALGGTGLARLEDVAGAGVRKVAVGKVESVPVGSYTKEALVSAKLWDTLQPRLVYADNVRQVLDYVARGEAEAGFVYRTDAALVPDKVKIVLTATGHRPVTYPMAAVMDSRQKPLAKAFMDFVAGPQGQAILSKYGFTKP